MVNAARIRWGVVGCGWVARDYTIPAIQSASNATLYAVCDVDPKATTGYPALTFKQLLASEVDALYIATPNDSHALLTAEAASAGKHVLCEKPMATNYESAQCMVAACAAAGVTYGTAFDQRFHPAHSEIRRTIENGDLGTITSARIHYACWLPPAWTADNWRIHLKRAGGGAFIDLAPHGIDLLQYLLADECETLSCLKQRQVFSYEVDDGAVGMGRMRGGCLLTMHVAYNCRDVFPRRTLEIIGTEAMIVARNTMGQTPGGTVEMMTASGASKQIGFDRDRSPFVNQVEAFSQCLLEQRPFPFTPQRDLHTMQVISKCL